MKGVELYARVRRAVNVEGLSRREAGRRFGVDPRTVKKMLAFSVPPGYRRSKPPVRPKLGPFTAIIDHILEEDKRRPAKQQHTSKRIFERLRDEHGYRGGITIVKDYVAGAASGSGRCSSRCARPGHAQADFGEALAVIGGVERKIHFFAHGLLTVMPASWAGLSGRDNGGLLRGAQCGLQLLRRGATVRSFYDNTKLAVARDPGGRDAAADPGVQRTAVALPVRRPVRAGRARGTTRAKLRGSSVTRHGTSSFRFPSSRASKR